MSSCLKRALLDLYSDALSTRGSFGAEHDVCTASSQEGGAL